MTIEDDYADKTKYVILPSNSKNNVGIIQAVRDIPLSSVKKGDIGGEVSGYHNLSQEGNCWIHKGSSVTGPTVVEGGTLIKTTHISENSSLIISGDWTELTDTTIERCKGTIIDAVIDDRSDFNNYQLKLESSRLKNVSFGKYGNNTPYSLTASGVKITQTVFRKNVKIVHNGSFKDFEIASCEFSGNVEIMNSTGSKIVNSRFMDEVIIRDKVGIINTVFEGELRAHDGATIIACRFSGPVRIFGGAEAARRVIKSSSYLWITKDNEGN